MFIYYVIQYSVLLVLCSYLVNYYASKSVSMHIKFWSVITWTLNFGITLLVPQDVYQTLNTSQVHSKQLSILGWQYLILYWLVYLLTWTIIPVLQQWENSADLQSMDRLKRSLKVNGLFYLYMIIGAVIALLLLLFFDVAGQMGLVSFLKCLATIWGLFLLMSLMGYALVQIPKTLWHNADPQTFLKYLYTKISQIQDQQQQAYQEFTKIVGYISYVQKNLSSLQSQQKQKVIVYCNESRKIIPVQYEDKINHKNYSQFLQKIDYLKDYPISLQSSIEHLRLIKRSITECLRLQRTLQYYCRNAILYQDIIKSQQNPSINHIQLINDSLNNKLIEKQNDKYDKNDNNNKNENNNKINSGNNGKILRTKLFEVKWLHSLWFLRVRFWVNRSLAILIGSGSIILMIAQTQVFLTQKSSILGWLLSIKNYQVLRLTVLIVIVFIMYMVNYSLFRLKLSNLYGLYYKDSDGPSLMFATVNFSRVGVVIVLNFFDMMKIESQYQNVMGTVDMGLLGDWVIKGLPGVLWIIVLGHYTNFWAKFLQFFKLDDSFSFNTHQVEKGKILGKSPHNVVKRRQKIEKQSKF